MPCNDWPRGEVKVSEKVHGLDVHQLAAILCGVLTNLERTNTLHLFNHVDWKETGVARESAILWWDEHKKHDTERREREATNQLRQRALDKLTAEERKVLGL